MYYTDYFCTYILYLFKSKLCGTDFTLEESVCNFCL